jgi:hypothetical protein
MVLGVFALPAALVAPDALVIGVTATPLSLYPHLSRQEGV